MDRKTHVVTKTSRATELYKALRSEVDAYLAAEPFSVYIDRGTASTALKLQMETEPPARWGAILGDIVHNVRSSLDVAVYQLVEANRGNAGNETRFPMSKNASSYPATARGCTAGLATAARQVIDASKPYLGGNDDLYLLHELDIEDKHHLLLALAASADIGMAVGPPAGPMSDGSYIQPIQWFGRAHSQHLFPLQNGSTLVTTDATIDDPESMLSHFNFSPFIAMKPERWPAHDDIFAILDRIGRAAEDVLNNLLPFFGSP